MPFNLAAEYIIVADQTGDAGITGVVHDFLGSIDLQGFSVVDDANPVSNPARFVQVVGDVNHRQVEA